MDAEQLPVFHFADDIIGLAGKEELAKLIECLDKASTAYGLEISAEKTKLMTNNTSGINTEIKVNGQRLAMIADNSKIYDSACNCIKIQEDIYRLQEWSVMWNLYFNVT